MVNSAGGAAVVVAYNRYYTFKFLRRPQWETFMAILNLIQGAICRLRIKCEIIRDDEWIRSERSRLYRVFCRDRAKWPFQSRGLSPVFWALPMLETFLAFRRSL